MSNELSTEQILLLIIIDHLCVAFEVIIREQILELDCSKNLGSQHQWSPVQAKLKSLSLSTRSLLKAIEETFSLCRLTNIQDLKIPPHYKFFHENEGKQIFKRVVSLKNEAIFFGKKLDIERSSIAKRNLIHDKINHLQHEVPFECFKNFATSGSNKNKRPLAQGFDFEDKWKNMNDVQKEPFRKMSVESEKAKDNKEDLLLEQIKEINSDTSNQIQKIEKEEEEEKKKIDIQSPDEFNLQDSIKQKRKLIYLLNNQQDQIKSYIEEYHEKIEYISQQIKEKREQIDFVRIYYFSL